MKQSLQAKAVQDSKATSQQQTAQTPSYLPNYLQTYYQYQKEINLCSISSTNSLTLSSRSLTFNPIQHSQALT